VIDTNGDSALGRDSRSWLGEFLKLVAARLLLALSVSASIMVAPHAQAASTIKAGAVCAKSGQTATQKGVMYKCRKVGKKLTWVRVATAVAKPTPKQPPIAAPPAVSPEGQLCSSYMDTAEFDSRSFVCREVSGGAMRFFEVHTVWPAATNSPSPDDFTHCRLPDKRVGPVTSPGSAITYPSTPHYGSVKKGVMRIAVVGFDFTDAPGSGSPLALFDDDLERGANFINWYSEGRAQLTYTLHPEWIRLGHPSAGYTTDEHFGPLGGRTLKQMSDEMQAAVRSRFALSGYTAIWFVYPPNADKVANNFGAAAGPANAPSLAIYGLGKSAFDQRLPLWTYFVHEMLHEQGLQGHSPKAPWTFGVLLNGNGLSSSMNSWDQLTNDWASNSSIYCVDRSRGLSVNLNLAPVERQQLGTHSIMVRLDDKRVLVVESHRRGEFSPGMPEPIYGLTFQVVDTSIDTTWDDDIATSKYIRVTDNHRWYPAYGQRIPGSQSSTAIWNGKGVVGAANAVDTNWFLLQGEAFTFEGVRIEYLKAGAVDEVRLTLNAS
jgi:hypothetical protein